MKIIILTLLFVLLFSFTVYSFNLEDVEIRKDKIMHFSAGAMIYSGMYTLEKFDIYEFENKMLMVLLVGIAKEVHDSFYESHSADIWDIVAAVSGGYVIHTVVEW